MPSPNLCWPRALRLSSRGNTEGSQALSASCPEPPVLRCHAAAIACRADMRRRNQKEFEQVQLDTVPLSNRFRVGTQLRTGSLGRADTRVDNLRGSQPVSFFLV